MAAVIILPDQWYWWMYLQGRNRDANVAHGLVDAGREKGRMNCESSIDIYILPHVK